MTDNKMKLHQLVAISDAITAILANNANLPAKLTFALVKNKNTLKVNVDAFNQAQEPSKEFKTYEEERMKICMELCDKDENGNPKFTMAIPGVTQQMFSMNNPENKKEFDEKFEALKETHKADLDVREAQLKDLETLLNTEFETSFTKIDLASIPDNAITPKQIEILYPLISE